MTNQLEEWRQLAISDVTWTYGDALVQACDRIEELKDEVIELRGACGDPKDKKRIEELEAQLQSKARCLAEISEMIQSLIKYRHNHR